MNTIKFLLACILVVLAFIAMYQVAKDYAFQKALDREQWIQDANGASSWIKENFR